MSDITVGRWTGRRAWRTEGFHVTAPTWRLAWQARRTGFFPRFAVDVRDALTGALVRRVIHYPGVGDAPLGLSPGRYVLDISAARVVWALRVVDERR